MANQDRDPKLSKRQADNVRARIAESASKIVDRLKGHVEGTVELAPTQVKAAQILLDRVLPSMQSIDQTSHSETPELGPEELDALLGQYLRDMARKHPDQLMALIDQPALQVIAGGKV